MMNAPRNPGNDLPGHGAAAGIDALYADAHLLVLNKPAGLLAVPGRGADKQDCLSARVQAAYADALVVHRLDQATSGIMLMARGAHVQRQLSEAFAARQVSKRYMAVVHGSPEADELDNEGWSTIDLPIAVDWEKRPLRIIDAVLGKPSVTRWRRAADQGGIAPGVTRLELEPVTGRSHQLRVHLQALGHPLLGDALYAPPYVQALSSRLLLHAAFLGLAHPATGEALAFESPAPF
jgi:tRNA pseudouridine32 synthase / 23S rRNA pseudouridine746 synthase